MQMIFASSKKKSSVVRRNQARQNKRVYDWESRPFVSISGDQAKPSEDGKSILCYYTISKSIHDNFVKYLKGDAMKSFRV